jgi:parallel beta-helix repeat protein
MKQILSCLLISHLFSIVLWGQVCIPQATPSSPQFYFNNAPSLIIGLRITNTSGHCLVLNNCHNITISNCVFSAPSSEAVVLEDCSNITIVNCVFKNMGNGVYAVNSQGIKVNNNQFRNVQYIQDRGQFVQFNTVSGAGNEIMNNVGENVTGNSSAEDLVNLYKSNGTAASPILVKGNRFRGGGPRSSSGGLMAGDAGGSYITVEDNILVDPGQYGVAVSSGTNIKLLHNKVYGRQQYFTNIGLYVWNQYAEPCGIVTVENNEINYTAANGTLNPAWDASNCGTVAGWNNNVWNAPIDETILPQHLLCAELVAWYKFNGNWYDETGNSLTASPNGPYTVPSCDGDGQSARFTGATPMLTLPRHTDLRTNAQKISVSCWIKPTSVTGIKAIARGQDGNGWDNSWRMIINNSVFTPHITTTQGSAEVYCSGISAGQWTHLVMTYDGKKLKGYVNGVLTGSTDISGDIVYYSNIQESMRIGFSNGDYYFNGDMDEFRFYAGDLNSTEVADLYNLHKDIFNTPHTPSFTVGYENNDQYFSASGYNYVTAGDTYLYVSSADPVSYTWEPLNGYTGLSTYGGSASMYLNYMEEASVLATASNACGGTANYTLTFFANQFYYYAAFLRESNTIRITQETSPVTTRNTPASRPGQQDYKVEVFNAAGQLVRKGVSRQPQLNIDATGLPGGAYILHIYGGGVKTVRKAIISR